jgi:hypothetical protein
MRLSCQPCRLCSAGVAAPLARRARQRLAPTRICQASPVGHSSAAGGRNPRFVGVRRRLTRRPWRAGQSGVDDVGRVVPIVPAVDPRCMGCAAPLARRARRRLAPTQVVAERPRCGLCRHGWAVREPRAVGVRRCLTRRFHPTRSAPVWGPGKAAGRGGASPRQGCVVPRGWNGWLSPARCSASSCRGQAVPDPPAR